MNLITNRLLRCVWPVGLMLILIRPSDEVSGVDRGTRQNDGDLVAKLERIGIQEPNKTRQTFPINSECNDGRCIEATLMQDLSNFMSEQRASSSPQSINTVNVKSGSGFSSNGATRGAQCGVPGIRPWVPDIDRVSNSARPRRGAPLPPIILNVVGGSETVAHSWPWQISMNVNGMHFCGGSIIHSRWIVTAAHCASPSWVKDYVIVSAGKHNLNRYEREHRLRIKRVILHNKYSTSTLDYDIALLELRTDIQFNDKVSPVCLPVKDVRNGQMCMTTGWGLTQGTGSSNVLNQVALPVIKPKICRKPEWNGDVSITNRVFCAGFKEGGKDSCRGDSGGPFVCRTNGVWHLNGIVGWGYGCARSMKPGVYTRVRKFVRWIERKTAGAVTS